MSEKRVRPRKVDTIC